MIEKKFCFVKIRQEPIRMFSDPAEGAFLDAQMFHELSCDEAMRTRYRLTWNGAQISEVQVLEVTQ